MLWPGPSLTTIIEVDSVAVASGLKLTVAVPVVANADALLSGLKGMLRHAVLAKRNLDEDRSTPGSNDDIRAFFVIIPVQQLLGAVALWNASAPLPPSCVLWRCADGSLMEAARVGDALSYLSNVNASQFQQMVTEYRSVFSQAISETKGIWPIPATRLDYSVALLESALV